jgi:biopolymer transport protein ExbB/TolQ
MNSDLIDFFFSYSSEQQLVGALVNAVIMVIGVVAVVLLVRGRRQLKLQHQELRAFAERVGGRTEPSEIASVASGLRTGTILRERVSRLRELNELGADIDSETLSALASSELERKLGFTRWAASTAVLLGLGGTLVGLAQAVMAAMPLLQDITTDAEAIQAVLNTFRGLGTAFSTTLMGILWAVVLGGGVALFRAEQGKFLEELEELTLRRLLPHFRTSASLAIVQAARSLAELETRVSSDLRMVIGEVRTQGLALTKIVEDSVSDLVVEARSTGKDLKSSVDQSVRSLVEETQSRGVALASTVDRSLQALAADFESSTTRLLDSFNGTNERVLRFLGHPSDDTRTLGQSLEELQRGVAAMQASAEALTRMTPSIEEAIARQVDRQSRDLHETIHGYVGRLGDTIERQDAVIESGLQGIRGGLPEFSAAISNRLHEHAQLLASVIDTRTAGLQQATEQQTERLADLDRSVQGLEAAARDMRGQVANKEDAVDKLIAQSSAMVLSLGAFSAQVGLLVQALDGRAQQASPPPRELRLSMPPHAPESDPPPSTNGKSAEPAGQPVDHQPEPKPSPRNIFQRLFGRA